MESIFNSYDVPVNSNIIVNQRVAKVVKKYNDIVWRLIFEDNKEIINVFFANSEQWSKQDNETNQITNLNKLNTQIMPIVSANMQSKGYYIFDRAHAENIAGKRSPDGKHLEWQWSDMFCKKLIAQCKIEGIRCEMYPTTSVVEVCQIYRAGKYITIEALSNRVDYYNAIKEKNKVVISNHNNASAKVTADKRNSDWDFANGVQVHTSMKEDLSDKIAEIFLKKFISLNPTLKTRRENNQEYDWDSDFTLLSGYKNSKGVFIQPNYFSILIEWFFMNNKVDVAKLNDPMFVNLLVDTLISAILEIDRLFE